MVLGTRPKTKIQYLGIVSVALALLLLVYLGDLRA